MKHTPILSGRRESKALLSPYGAVGGSTIYEEEALIRSTICSHGEHPWYGRNRTAAEPCGLIQTAPKA